MVVEERITALVRRHGPLSYADVLELALYDPDGGFYSRGGHAGRRGDFLTSPEVGPLFGAVIARALDAWWDELGQPDPYFVVECGAGVGTLAIAVAAAPSLRCGPALTYVPVERSSALRSRHADHLDLATAVMSPEPGSGPRFVSLADLPAVQVRGVILANELLDNLPWRVIERGRDEWLEVRVGLTGDALPLREVVVSATDDVADAATRLTEGGTLPVGARFPLQEQAGAWLARAISLVERGRVVVIDYGSTTADLAARPMGEWMRLYRGHDRGTDPLVEVGTHDITCEVCTDQLARVRAPSTDRSQAELLRAFGIDELVAEGRRIWNERAAIGDLDAVRARSRVREAEALLDPSGLGGFRVLEWIIA